MAVKPFVTYGLVNRPRLNTALLRLSFFATTMAFQAACVHAGAVFYEEAAIFEDNILFRSPNGPVFVPQYLYGIELYDSEGHSGMKLHGERNPLFFSRVGLENGTVIEQQEYLTPIDAQSGRTGVPFWWEITTPWSGIVRGWSTSTIFSDAGLPRFMVPVPGSEAGISLPSQADIPGGMSIDILASLVDEINGPSPLVRNRLSHLQRTSIITAVYLPGNAISSSIGLESHFFDINDLSSNQAACLWGNDLDVAGSRPYYALFSHQLPLGPILLAFTFDGSTTSMLEITGYSSIYYSAELPFAPLPGSTIPTATEILGIGDPPPFIMESTYAAVLLGDSVDLTRDLDAACDRNHDGIIDIADRFRYSVLEEEGK